MLRNWLQALLKLSDFFGVGLKDVLEILSRILELGMPPAISDEDALRAWLKAAGEIAADVADLSETTGDDQLAAFCQQIVENEDTWQFFYSVLSLVAEGNPPPVGDVKLEWIAFALPSSASISQSLILELAMLIWKLIDAWRENKVAS